MTDSQLVEHTSCDSCGSSDANAVYDDGHTFCFSCSRWTPGDSQDSPKQPTSRNTNLNLIQSEKITRSIRGISPTTFQFWKYEIGELKDGSKVHVANHFKKGQKVGQKIRTKDKDFKVFGNMEPLYGMWLWNKAQAKKIVITEGELDALSVAQVQGNKWPVVSIPNGAQGAVKSVKAALEYLESFEEIILMFDMDEPGRNAMEKVAQLFKPGKCKLARLPEKDANAMLVMGKTQEITQAIWNAEEYRPDGIVTLSDCEEEVLIPAEWGYSYPWDSLTKITWGRRLNESYFIGAGTGIGKTTFVLEMIHHDVQNLKLKTGVIPLEQVPKKFFQRLAGLIGNKKFHKPSDGTWDAETLKAALSMINRDDLFIYDSKGSRDWDDILTSIRYLAVSCGCTSIYLDNLTGLQGRAGESHMEFMNRVSADIASLVVELPIMFTVVSHLATPEKGSHEEGARVKIREFKGSRNIGADAFNAIGLERDQQGGDMKDVTTVRFLKDREVGEATGRTTQLKYDHDTGRLLEFDRELESSFDDDEDPF